MKSIILLGFLFIMGCATVKKTPIDIETYGYSESNPIKVGDGPSGERAYLDRLSGPDGQTVKYKRLGSCCPFKTRKGVIDNTGLLDTYEVTYDGLQKNVILFFNMYDKGQLIAPKGFTLSR
jgi:hypothetical protein